MNIENYKIIIIGAGMAGLGAATKLSQLGETNYKILEAKDRPGGRVHTISINDRPLDLGAQWLHGKDNSLYEICTKNDLLCSEMSEEGLGIFVRNDGFVFDDYLVKQVDFKIGQILEECQSFVDAVDHPSSVGEYLESEFNKYLNNSCDSDEVRTMKQELFDWHVRFQIIDNSCNSLKDLSAKGWGEYVCLDDIAHYNLKDGYASLVEVIVNGLPENCIVFNTEVEKIEFSDRGTVLLSCKASRNYSCDYLIITMSLGVLKNFKNITPPLPTHLSRSIRDVGFEGISKIYLFFEEKWWGDTKAFQLVFQKGYVFNHDKKWLRHLQGFDEVLGQPAALLGWVGGEGVRLVEAVSDAEVGEVCVRILRKFLVGFNVPTSVRCIRTRWLSDPHIRGSYCHITPASDSGESGIRQLSEPVVFDGVPRMFLAGEAVHPRTYSTTHGAYESGQNQAERLMQFL